MTDKDREHLARLIRKNVPGAAPVADAGEYAARIVEHFHPERPCHYAYECVMHGHCPFDPVCNN